MEIHPAWTSRPPSQHKGWTIQRVYTMPPKRDTKISRITVGSIVDKKRAGTRNQSPLWRLSHKTERPSQIVLSKRKPAASGPDGITYDLLKMFPDVFGFLATIFNKLLVKGCLTPPSWRIGRQIWLFKDGKSTDPANYRLITLTSCIGEVFHSIIEQRLLKYGIANKILDATVRKGFIENMNGCGQHAVKHRNIIEKQRKRHRSLHVLWLDIRNAYGSVHHSLIKTILEKNRVPQRWIDYISDSTATSQLLSLTMA